MPALIDENGNPIDPEDTDALREARERLSEGAANRTRADNAEREIALMKALPGVDFADARVAMFMRAYDGKLDGEAIKAQAIAVGVLDAPSTEDPPAAPPADPAVSPEEQAIIDEQTRLQAAREAIRLGAAPPQTQEQLLAAQEANTDPRVKGIAEFRRAVEEDGRTREDASAELFDRLVDSAVKGDERVLWTPEKQQEMARAAGA